MNVTKSHDFTIIDRSQAGVRLTARQRQLLDYLASHEGKIVHPEELGAAVFGGWFGASTVRTVVDQIRARLGDDVIETVYGDGYRVSLGRSAGLARRCGRCGKAIVDYGQEWACHGCGASGSRPRFVDELATETPNEYQCGHCGRVFSRSRRQVEYEQRRRPGAGVYCGLRCSRAARWDGRRPAARGTGSEGGTA